MYIYIVGKWWDHIVIVSWDYLNSIVGKYGLSVGKMGIVGKISLGLSQVRIYWIYSWENDETIQLLVNDVILLVWDATKNIIYIYISMKQSIINGICMGIFMGISYICMGISMGIYHGLNWNRYRKPVGFPFGNRMEDMQRFTREVKTYVVYIYSCT